MSSDHYYRLILLPVLIAGAGVIASLIGVIVVASLKAKDARKALGFGNVFTGILVLASTALVIGLYAPDYKFKDEFIVNPDFVSRWRIFLAIASGLIAGLIISKLSEYFTSTDYSPTRKLAQKHKLV